MDTNILPAAPCAQSARNAPRIVRKKVLRRLERSCYRQVVVRKFRNRIIPKGIILDRGYVYVRIYHDGRQIQKCAGNANDPGVIDDAIALLIQYREKIRLDKLGLEQKERHMTMDEALDLFWEHHGSKLRSFRSMKTKIKHLRAFFKDRFLDEITYLDVEDYRRAMSARFKGSTVNKEHQTLITLYNLMKRWKAMKIVDPVRLPAENPASLVKRVDERQFARTRVLTEEEFHQFMEAAPTSIRRIVLAAVNTTLRASDLRELSRGHINPATNQLEGTQSKTGKPFAIPINDVMRLLIDTAQGDKLFDFTNFEYRFEKARAKSGIAYFQFRDLRRTGARMMHTNGIELATVSAYLGHASLQMTQTYLPTTSDHKRRGSQILGTVFPWKPETEKECAPALVSVG